MKNSIILRIINILFLKKENPAQLSSNLHFDSFVDKDLYKRKSQEFDQKFEEEVGISPEFAMAQKKLKEKEDRAYQEFLMINQ